MKNIEKLPLLPGVYFFRNKEGEIIYIGKAKSIKVRVASYFKNKIDDWKIKGIVAECETVEYQVTHNEVAALILEAEMIKKYKPRFNLLLKFGSPFVYLLFQEVPYPDLVITRILKKNSIFLGPFMNKKALRRILFFLQTTFQLYRCNKTISNGCLHYHLGLCAGSCRTDFNETDYRKRLKLAYSVLTDNHDSFIQLITDQIKAYNKEHAFEKALSWADYLKQARLIFDAIADSCDSEKFDRYNKKTLLKVDPLLSQSLKKFLDLNNPVNIIDCFDISHFQSQALVGSCIRFVDGVPEPSFFRHFIIESMTEQNDYAALQEIITRRYADDSLPDLILIDGGKGQLSAIKKIFPQASLAALAKREERLFCDRFPDGIILDKHSKLGLLLIEIRNYTHHFAISYHRKRRKQYTKSLK